jgi:hypothetical protein
MKPDYRKYQNVCLTFLEMHRECGISEGIADKYVQIYQE